jgi:hypothetical protein
MRRHGWSTRRSSTALLLATAVGIWPVVVRAQAPAKDERALSVLARTCATLAKAKTISFRARDMVSTLGPAGQWIDLIGTARVVAERPDKLFVETRGDRFPQDFFYDGKTITMYAPHEKIYAQADAPPTLEAMIQHADDIGGITFPFADVLPAEPCSTLTKDLTTALYVGESTVGGAKTEHLAFATKNEEWQIWIGAEDHLPRMLLARYRDVEGAPRITVEFSDWKVGGPSPASTFGFKAPSGAVKTEFKKPGAPGAAGAK